MSVCDVGVRCGQAVRWIKMKLGMQVGLGPGHIVFIIIFIIEIYSAPISGLHGEHRCITRVINSRQQ